MNKHGVGGFSDHPENINKKGRPKIDGTELLLEALKKCKEDPKYGDLILNIIKRAFTSDALAAKIADKILPALGKLELEGSVTIADLLEILKNKRLNNENK